MVGVQQMPYSNQDTQANIESYHSVLESIYLTQKNFKGCKIDWLMWRLTTTITRHYMHTWELKKKGFIKNKVVEAIVTRSVEKVTLIPFTHVYQPTFESDGIWGVQSQHFPNITYAIKFLFTEISCSTCEWALQGTMCKHQIVVILACTNIT